MMVPRLLMDEKFKTFSGTLLNSNASPVNLYKSPSMKYRRKVEDLPPLANRSAEKPKAVLIYRNGDIHFRGLQVTVTPKRFRNFDNLLNELTRVTNLPQGARYIFTPTNGTRVESLEQLHNGESYVCDSRPKLKKIDYNKIPLKPRKVMTAKDFKPGSYNNTTYQTHYVEQPDNIKPKTITAVRNGVTRPHAKVKLLLSKRTAHTLVQVLDNITSAIGSDGCIRKLYNLQGKRIQKLAELFNEDEVFIAVGNERFRSCDMPIIKDELVGTNEGSYKSTSKNSGASSFLSRKHNSLRNKSTKTRTKHENINTSLEYSLLKIQTSPIDSHMRRNSEENDTIKEMADLPIVKQYDYQPNLYIREGHEQFLNNISYINSNDNIYIQHQQRSKVDEDVLNKNTINHYRPLPSIGSSIVPSVKQITDDESNVRASSKKRSKSSIQSDDEYIQNNEVSISSTKNEKIKLPAYKDETEISPNLTENNDIEITQLIDHDGKENEEPINDNIASVETRNTQDSSNMTDQDKNIINGFLNTNGVDTSNDKDDDNDEKYNDNEKDDNESTQHVKDIIVEGKDDDIDKNRKDDNDNVEGTIANRVGNIDEVQNDENDNFKYINLDEKGNENIENENRDKVKGVSIVEEVRDNDENDSDDVEHANIDKGKYENDEVGENLKYINLDKQGDKNDDNENDKKDNDKKNDINDNGDSKSIILSLNDMTEEENETDEILVYNHDNDNEKSENVSIVNIGNDNVEEDDEGDDIVTFLNNTKLEEGNKVRELLGDKGSEEENETDKLLVLNEKETHISLSIDTNDTSMADIQEQGTVILSKDNSEEQLSQNVDTDMQSVRTDSIEYIKSGGTVVISRDVDDFAEKENTGNISNSILNTQIDNTFTDDPNVAVVAKQSYINNDITIDDSGDASDVKIEENHINSEDNEINADEALNADKNGNNDYYINNGKKGSSDELINGYNKVVDENKLSIIHDSIDENISTVPVVNEETNTNQLFSNEGINAFYEIGEILGDGNFAVVRTAMDIKTNKDYALKIIDASKIEGKEELLQNEITIQRQCNHPNLVKLYHDFHSPTEIFLVMELVTGGDFFDYISDNVKLEESEASIYTRDMCSGIDYLHHRGIVHRDIKPENLLLSISPRGEAMIKIADFGLAQKVTTPIYTVCGTPTYVAPEILREDGYGIEVDIWAAGVILYIMLCGFPPFRSNQRGQSELFDLIETGEFEFLPPYWDEISDFAKYLINGMLVVDVGKRFTTKEILKHGWLKKYDLSRTNTTVDEPLEKLTFKTVGKGALAIEKMTVLVNSKLERDGNIISLGKKRDSQMKFPD